jgi:hypothetical protein
MHVVLIAGRQMDLQSFCLPAIKIGAVLFTHEFFSLLSLVNENIRDNIGTLEMHTKFITKVVGKIIYMT